jgi:hypothetical protein
VPAGGTAGCRLSAVPPSTSFGRRASQVGGVVRKNRLSTVRSVSYSEDEQPIGLNLMISWSSSNPDDLKLVDMRESGVHLPVSARDLAWLLSVVRRINVAATRTRRTAASERFSILARTWHRVRETERETRRLRTESAAERTKFDRNWRSLMHDSPW